MNKGLFSRKEKKLIKSLIKSSFSIFFMFLSAFWFVFKSFITISMYLFRFIGGFIYVRFGNNNSNILDNLTPRQFEVLCGELFKHQGYKVEITKATADYGRDIILNKDGEITFVECKYYGDGSTVGREICQKLIGSMIMLNADKSIVITTGKYNKNAFEVANKVNNLKLMDAADINNMISQLDKYELNRVKLKLNNCA